MSPDAFVWAVDDKGTSPFLGDQTEAFLPARGFTIAVTSCTNPALATPYIGFQVRFPLPPLSQENPGGFRYGGAWYGERPQVCIEIRFRHADVDIRFGHHKDNERRAQCKTDGDLESCLVRLEFTPKTSNPPIVLGHPLSPFEASDDNNMKAFFNPNGSPYVWTFRRFLAAQQFNIVFPPSELHILAGAIFQMRQAAYLNTLLTRPALFSALRETNGTRTM